MRRKTLLFDPVLKWHRAMFKTTLTALILVLGISAASAQNIVKGTITDENKSPMPGVNILLKGTSVGTTTDANGEFSMDIPSGNENGVFVVTFIGYVTEEIPIAGKSSFNVNLTPSIESLSEVVVVGYGTQKKTDLTGAVASVNLTDLRNAPNTNIAQMMQGTVPGLNVGVATTSGGTPPISIRGQVTLGGSQAVLIILDGVQFNGSLSSINPDDIASIDVLKDASSTAVYGAQAANGVILITSRKGKTGKPRISFSTTYSTQTPVVGNFVPKNREHTSKEFATLSIRMLIHLNRATQKPIRHLT